MTAQIPEDPLFIERIAGGNFISAFEDELRIYNIHPVFVKRVVARKLTNGVWFLNGYFAFERKNKLNVEFILYSLRRALNARRINF